MIDEENMFKISKGYDTVAKTIRISEQKNGLLEKLAFENSISFNKLVNQCIDFAMKNLYVEKNENQDDNENQN